MKYFVAVALLLFSVALAAQTGDCYLQTARMCTDSQTISTSGNTITITNNGGMVPTFEEIVGGTPATVSVVVQGCNKGNTCETIDTNTTVGASIRAPVVTKAYTTYKITATWTGGTSPSVVINTQITSASRPPITTAPGASPTSASTYFNDFYSAQDTQCFTQGAVVGAACDTQLSDNDPNHPGTFRLLTGTGGTGTGYVMIISSANAPSAATPLRQPWIATNLWTAEQDVQILVLPGTTAATYQAGLLATATNDPFYFQLSSTLGVANNWYCTYGTSGAPTNVNSGVTAVAGAWTRLTIKTDGAFFHWYINGVEVCPGIAVSVMPQTSTWWPMYDQVLARSGTSVTMGLDYVYFTRQVSR